MSLAAFIGAGKPSDGYSKKADRQQSDLSELLAMLNHMETPAA